MLVIDQVKLVLKLGAHQAQMGQATDYFATVDLGVRFKHIGMHQLYLAHEVYQLSDVLEV